MRWKKLLDKVIIPIGIFVIPLCLIIWLFSGLFFGHNQDLPTFTILNGECLFEINTNGVEVLHNNRLRLIIDDKSYWINVEKDINFRETGTSINFEGVTQ